MLCSGLWAAMGLSACTQQPQRPPHADLSCPADQPNCRGIPRSQGAVVPAVTDDSGAPIIDGGVPISLPGTVFEFTGSDFFLTTPYSGSGTAFADGADGSLVTAPIQGGTFNLNGVATGTQVWAGVEPPDTSTDLLTTLTVFDTTVTAQFVLDVATATIVDEALTTLSPPTARDAQAAQLVLAFVDTGGHPVAGVQVAAPLAPSQLAYRISGVWTSDSPTGTDDLDGLALLANLPASPLPGSYTLVTYTTPAGDSPSIWVRVVANAVTVVSAPAS